MSLRGDKSRLDLVRLDACFDETGSGCIAVEGVYKFFLMVELILEGRHLRRSLVDEGQELLNAPIRSRIHSRKRHREGDNYT